MMEKGKQQDSNEHISGSRRMWLSVVLTLLMLLVGGFPCKAWAVDVTVNYVIVALDGSRALTIKNQSATVGADLRMSTQLAKYKSPMVLDSEYSFYTTFANAQARTSAITTVPATVPGDTIYVRYTFEPASASRIGLTDGELYNIRRVGDAAKTGGSTAYLVQDDYSSDVCAYFSAGSKASLYTGEQSLRTGRFMWKLTIKDPYQLTIQTQRADDKNYADWYLSATGAGDGFKNIRQVQTLATAQKNKVWAYGIVPGDADGAYKLIVCGNATGQVSAGLDEQGHGYLNNARSGRLDYAGWSNHTGSNKVADYSDLEFKAVNVYHIINKAGRKALSQAVDNLTTLAVPDELKTPYITNNANYKFFDTQAHAQAYSRDGTTTGEITTVGEMQGPSVYIGYQWDGTVPSGLPRLDGSSWHQVLSDSGNKYFITSGATYTSTTNTATVGTEYRYLWSFMGEDPYDITVTNLAANESNGSTYQLALSDNYKAYDSQYGWYRLRMSASGGFSTIIVNSGTADRYNLITLSSDGVVGTENYVRALWCNASDVLFIRLGTNYKDNADARYRFQFPEVPMAQFKFHLTTQLGGVELTATQTVIDYASVAIALPEELQRKYCSYTFYPTQADADAGTNALTTYGNAVANCATVDGVYQVYAKYDVDELPFAVSTDYEHAHWYRLKAKVGDATAYAHWIASHLEVGTDGVYTHDYQYAFFGDPYELKVTNRAGSDGQYLGVSDDPSNGDEISLRSSGHFTWEILNSLTAEAGNFQLRAYGTAGNDYYVGYTNSGTAKYYNANPMTLSVEDLPKRDYTYNIVDKMGRIAIKATVEQYINTPIRYDNIPTAIRSPYIEGETLTGYLTKTESGTSYDRATYNLSNVVTETPVTSEDSETDIYIRYTTDHLLEKTLRINGNRSYNVVRVRDSRYVHSSAAPTVEYNASATTSDKQSRQYLWSMEGSDPYAVLLKNTYTSKYFAIDMSGMPPSFLLSDVHGLSSDNAFFILMGGTTDPSKLTQVNMMAATGSSSSGAEELRFENNLPAARYHIIDRQHKVVIDAEASAENSDLELPVSIQSPLVSRYHYWKFSSLSANSDGTGTPDVLDAGATFYVKDGEDEITSIGEALGGGDIHIYCTYDVADEDMFANAKHYRAKGYDIGKENTLVNGVETNTNETPPMYLLKFLHGKSFYQEDGHDALMGTAQKAVYPYNNGDAGLYVYGQEQWETQLESGASTRGRWPWFIESETLDPYHVYVSSRQSQAGSYSYLRTYKPQDYSEIVTGVITLADTVRLEEKNPDKYTRQKPTEYMILGTTGHGRFVTVEKVAIDLNGDDDTEDEHENERRTVTSFEQYWKNNPTANNLLEAAGKGRVTANEESVSLTSAQLDYLEGEDNIRHKGAWHQYKAWANSAPWTKRTDGTTNKKYEYKDHWFQTIDMEDGEFALEETSLSAVLVLLDQHGWEIARVTLPNGPDDPTRAERYAALQKYSSPMVKTYHYWKTGSKVPGYHKFNVSDYAVDENEKEYTSAKLGFLDPDEDGVYRGLLPNYDLQGKVNNMSRDWYVTYDVKDEYADSYRGAATEGATEASAFMVGYNSLWATTTNGNSLSTTATPVTYAGVTDNMLWNLRPNFNIDREMGYIYTGDVGQTPQDGAPTKTELDAQNYSEGRNVFDPYNVQLQNKAYPTKYITTNANAAAITAGVWQGTYATSPGTLSLNELGVQFTAMGHDQTVVKATNATFMVVDDGHGNMRLMPRFDHSKNAQSLASLQTPAAAEPKDDKTGTQTVLLVHPAEYTYHVINKNGREAITYKKQYFSSDAFVPDAHFPDELRAYGVKDGIFKYYPQSEFDPDPLSRNVYRLVSPATAKSLSTYATFGNKGDIYVMYDLDDSKVLSSLYNLKLNDTNFLHYDASGNTTSATATSLDTDETKNQENIWRIAANDGDPYDVRLYNFRQPDIPMSVATLGSSPTATENQTYQTFILTAQDAANMKFRLLATHSESVTSDLTPYAYLGLSGTTPQVLTTSPQWFKLYPVTLGFTYKLYDLAGNLTLQSTVSDVTDMTPSLPQVMKSPLVKQYYYYRDEAQAIPVTSLASTVDNIVYVGYEPYPLEEASLKLDGSVPYTLFDKDHPSNLYAPNNGSTGDVRRQSSIYLREPYYRWYLTARQVDGKYDPYDVTLTTGYNNYAWSNNMVEYVNEATTTGSHNLSLQPTTSHRYMIMSGVEDGGIQYLEILQKKLDSKGYHPNCTDRYQYVYYNNDGRLNAGQGASYVHENANMQFHFQPAYTYHVLNLQGKEAVSTIVGRMLKSDTELELEDVIKSPLVDTYHYYDATSFDVSADGVYTLKSTAKELTLLSEAKTADIYVTYGKHEINNLIDLNGQTAYNMITGTPASGTHGSYTWYDAEARSLKGTNQYYRNGAYETDANPDAETQKTRPYLWRFFGGDPYALTIQNALYTDRYIYRSNGVNQYGSVLNLGTTNDETFRTFILTGTKDDTSTAEDDDFKFQIMGSGVYSQTNNTYKCKFQYLGRNVTDNPHRNHTGIELWGFEFGWGDFIYGTSIVRVKLQPQNQGKITYIVLNKRGDEAIHYKVDATQQLPPELPAAIKSPYAKNFKYYTSKAKTTEIISDNADTYMVNGAEVYVTYDADTDALADAALDLTGSDSYNLWANGVYLYNASAADDDKIVTDASPVRYDDTMHEWYLVGNGNPESALDPYNVHLKSKQKPTKYIEMATYDPDMPGNTLTTLIIHSDGNEVPAFILMDGQPGNLELLAATGEKTNQATADDEIDNRLMYLGYYAEPQLMGLGSDPLHPVNRSGMSRVQIRLKQPLAGVTYHIINLSSVEVVQYTVSAAKGDALAVPEAIFSPFATNWQYWSDEACSSAITVVPNAGAHIYVTYSYNDETQNQLQLDGQRFYNMQVANRYIQEDDGAVNALPNSTLTTEEANVTSNLWGFNGTTVSKGIDPYALHLENISYPGLYVGAPLSYVNDTETTVQMSDGETENFRSTFFLVGTDPAGPYELVLASGKNITNNVLAYVNRHDETTINLNREEDYQHGNAALQIRMISPVNQYLYKVYNRNGDLAIQAWGDGVAGAVPEIPSAIKSPLVSRFYYDVASLPYTTGQDEVVVTYDVDDEATLVPNLSGTKLYNMKFRNSYYIKSDGTDVSLLQDTEHSNLGTPATVVDGGSDTYIWEPSANMGDGKLDPYAVRLRHSNNNVLYSNTLNLGLNDIALAATPGTGAYQEFILLEGSDGRYQFMAATGEELDSKPNQNLFAYLGVTSDNQAKLLIGNAYTQDRAAIQVELVPFQYTYTYVVVNNNRYEAIRNESVHDAGDPVSLPLGLNSPLIDASEYTYYTPEAFTITGDWGTTRFEYAADSASHTVSTLPYSGQTIYVRYKYTPKAGGLDIGNAGEAPKVKYQVGYITSDMQRYLYANTAESVKDIYTASTPSSNANYLWKLDASGDPYDVSIINMHDNRSGDVLDLREVWWYSKNGNGSLSWSGRAPYPHMYPEEGDPVTYTVAVDGENNVTGTNKTTRFAIVEHPDGGYRLMLIAPFTWHDELDGVDRGDTNFGTYFLFNLSSNRFTSISTSSSTPESGAPIYFIPATTHNYRFHLTTKIEERTLVVDKEKQMVRDPFSLPEELQRKYCTYTYKYYTTDADEDHREPVEKGVVGAVEWAVEADNFGITYYPYFPAIDGDNSKWVDIYVDYEVIPNGEPGGIPFNLMTSDRARTQALFDSSSGILDMAFDLTSYDKMVEKLSWTGLRRCDYLYFMVLKTNDDYSNNNGQYFLRRESNGRISCLNNDFRLYKDSEKNYNKWPYARCAEAYRENDHDPFQEKRWLWSFAGDPYDLYVFNTSAAVEENYNAITGETTFNTHRDHLVSYQTLVSTSGTTTEHVVNTPGYEELAPRHYLWGLAEGQGANSSQTFSLITGEFQYDEEDDVYRNPTMPNIEERPLYWRMDKSVVEGVTEVMLQPRAQANTTLDYNLQVLPFEPTKFVDLRFIVRRDDEVGKTTDEKSKGTYLGNYPVSVADSISLGLILPEDAAAKSQASSQFIDHLPSGTVRMFYEKTDRMFAAGDVIDTEHPETLPIELRRQFCNYIVYTDDYRNTGDYTVSGDYFRGTPQTDPITGDPIYNEAGMLMYNFFKYQRDGSGNLILLPSGDPLVVGTAPQTIYVKYEVTTDKFLKKHPTKEEVNEMLANNDHVYFMDFANPNLMKGQKLGYNTGHHAYYDEETTFEGQIGRLYEGVSAEKRIWDGTQFVDDTNQRFNYCHYRTTTNRMESVPENLKWYFVGDPYKLQVYCTQDEFNKETVRLDGKDCTPGTVPSNLCRFDPTESNFQFVVDCVHFRTPDENFIDERRTLDYIDADGNKIIVENANYGKPYYDNFYWEVVPTTTDDKEAFALRFRADNQILGYRNVFYYLAHDGLKRTYREARSENPKAYSINLSYDENNTRHLSGRYVGYHQANDVNCVIRLTPPTKIYFTAYKETYGGQPVVKEELSEYFGLGETLTEVPRHLQRKFVKYGNLEYQTSSPDTWHTASFPFTMYNDSAYNLENCNLVAPVHTIANEWVHQEGVYGEDLAVTGNYTKTRASFKFRVTYEVDDVIKDGIHLFTTPAEFANADVQPQWLDVTVGGDNWMYYDKTNLDAEKMEDDTLHVSRYPTAANAEQAASGWDTGLKGLHWAFIGDPYKFTIINRRRWEDVGSPRTAVDGSNFWLGTGYGQYSQLESGAYKYYNYTRLGDTNENHAYGRNGSGGNTENGNTEWGLIMCKTGGTNDYFLRTASPKTTTVSELVGDYSNDYQPSNYTNDYARIVRKDFTNQNGSAEPLQSAYVLETFSLATKTNQIHKARIRTAVAEDDDGADNNCFDATVRIYNTAGELKATLKHVEVVYGDVVKSLPKTLKRFGCNYTECYQLSYLGYTPEMIANPTSSATLARTAAITTAVANLNNFTGENIMGSLTQFNDATLNKEKAITDLNGRRYLEIAYVYEVTDDVSQFFTSQDDASQDNYYWSNAYYQWDQTYKGSNVRVVTYENQFDHYDYNADGHIVNEVYKQVEKVEYKTGDDISTPAYGWINSHEDSDQAFGNDLTQNEEDRQKWSFVGDPYDFELKNYAQYLENSHSAYTADHSTPADDLNASVTEASHWAIVQGLQKTEVVNGKKVNVVDANGDPVYLYYLALIDDETGLAIDFVTFDRASENKDLDAYRQYLYLKGSPLEDDPTGNFYSSDTKTVRPFYISDLLSYANWVVYHLVIAHQHSLDYQDTFADLSAAQQTEAKRIIDQRLVEWLKYQHPDYMKTTTVDGYVKRTEQFKDTYVETGTGAVTDDLPLKDQLTSSAISDIQTLLKVPVGKTGTLRDLVNDSVADYRMERVGIGNTLKEPWFMRRQFCSYKLYQRDVLRSLTSTRPAYEEDGVTQKTFIDPETGEEKLAYEIDWVSVTEEPTARGYATILAENGQPISKLNDSHRGRMVIVDVVYEVNEDEFRFSDKGRNTTAWYSMQTMNDNAGLMNFSYKDGIGARHGREAHYTNNYLWAPEGDPYGFVMHSRYATINGTGWDNVAVTTPGKLPRAGDAVRDKVGTLADYSVAYDPEETLSQGDSDKVTYTGGDIPFQQGRIIHRVRGEDGAKTWGARNAVYEMYVGNFDENAAFLMHPTSAYVNVGDDQFGSFYMLHNTTRHTAQLQYYADVKSIRSDRNANWCLTTTPEQLLPYFERSGYVGGLEPDIANRFENQSLYSTLQYYKENYRSTPSVIDFKTIDKARELVYGGTFYKRGGLDEAHKLLHTAARPTAVADLPLKFVSNNLVPLQKGYYRVVALSRDALDKDGADLDGTGIMGIQGPRYISGYRFQSEKDYEGYTDHDDDPATPMKLKSGSRYLHFIETDEEHTTLKTYEDLNAKIRSLDGSSHYERDIEPHPAMRGNIEILPAEYDPSSIFYFQPTNDAFDRFRFGTQGLGVVGSVGSTSLADGAGTDFRMDDIGGTAVTMRVLSAEPSNADADHTWDSDDTSGVAKNIQTNYLCIDPTHRYRITVNANNEMKEIGDGYGETEDDYWKLSDINYGIQDTKWLLQPVGVQTEWPYNQKPLSVRVNKGGQKANMLTGAGLAGEENKDGNYYASLCVPFDSRLSKTVDAAFTNTNATPTAMSITLKSVSQLNNMGNPQFIPAGWPVVIRTSTPVTSIIKEDGSTMKSDPHVDLYLPNPDPTVIPENFAKIKLWGEYLEDTLTAAAIETRTGVADGQQKVMVVGLPFVTTGTNNVYGVSTNSGQYYGYNTGSAVGFYTNENWNRGYYDRDAELLNGVASPTDFEALSEAEKSKLAQSHWATARTATSYQRSNTYVYHNKAYYVYDTGAAPVKGDYYYFLFDDIIDDEAQTHPDDALRPSMPRWGVYDLSGRLLRTREAVLNGTWRRNLPPGMYIVNGRKMPVK